MPNDVAHRFLTDLDHVHRFSVGFETQGSTETWQRCHILRDHKMEVPGLDEGMTLFVADTPESLSKIVSMLQMSMSVKGLIQNLPVVDSLSRRVSNLLLRKRFYSGVAKLVSWDRFLERFCCTCPAFKDIRWFGYRDLSGNIRPNAHLTWFLNDVVSMSNNNTPDSRPTLMHLLGMLEPTLFQKPDISLPSVPGWCQCTSEYECSGHFRSVEKLRMLAGSWMPPLQRNSKTLRKFSFDARKLYCWDCASVVSL